MRPTSCLRSFFPSGATSPFSCGDAVISGVLTIEKHTPMIALPRKRGNICNIRPPTRMEIERGTRHRRLYHLRRAAADSGGALPNLVPRPERAEIVASFSPAVLWYLPPSPLSPAVSFYTTVATIRSFRAFPNAAFYPSPILLRLTAASREGG